MHYDDFVAAVARRAECEPHQAEAASKAVLRVLGEQVSDNLFARLATQLPGTLKAEVPAATSRQLSLAEFYGRVSELGGPETVGSPQRPVQAVLATLADAVSAEQMQELAAELPGEYGQVLPAAGASGGAGEFLAKVQRDGQLASAHDAEEVTRTTLLALAERLTAGQAHELAASLPEPLRAPLTATHGDAEAFDRQVFINRIMDKRGVDAGTAEQQVRAVLRGVGEHAARHEVGDTIAQLPGDLARMFE